MCQKIISHKKVIFPDIVGRLAGPMSLGCSHGNYLPTLEHTNNSKNLAERITTERTA